jgi:hypothetical protein
MGFCYFDPILEQVVELSIENFIKLVGSTIELKLGSFRTNAFREAADLFPLEWAEHMRPVERVFDGFLL